MVLNTCGTHTPGFKLPEVYVWLSDVLANPIDYTKEGNIVL